MAVIARHGQEITAAVAARGMYVLIEAALAGGIPIINGTTNYILSCMAEQGAAYLTAPKITILAFGGAVLRPGIAHGGHRAAGRPGGISRVRTSWVSWSNFWRWANTLSRERKPLRSSMYDCAHSLAEGEPAGRSAVDNNPLLVEGDPAGRFMFYGPAAGAGSIASAEVADILNIAGIRCVGGPQAWLEPFPSLCHQLETLRSCGWRRHVPLQRSVLLQAPRSGCDCHDPPQGLESSLRQPLAAIASFPEAQAIAASLRTL
ncbi:hypothetical protein H6G65_18565 [Microcystis elabens FACHB-917]|nr:hypothetical protein [Microcystis elabens FACHB-917]